MAKIIVKAPFYKPGHTTESGQSRGGYAHYIGTREGVEILRSGMAGYIGERRGSHGLFSDEGVDVSLSKISEEIDNHPGNVWGFIISLKREDAERVGYNSAEQWVNLLRSRRNVIAKEMGITPSNLRWVAAYHNNEVRQPSILYDVQPYLRARDIFAASSRCLCSTDHICQTVPCFLLSYANCLFRVIHILSIYSVGICSRWL